MLVRVWSNKDILLCRCAWSLSVFLYQPGLLWDHVWNAINDGICNAELLVDQLVGVGIVPENREDVLFCHDHVLVYTSEKLFMNAFYKNPFILFSYQFAYFLV